MGAHKFGSIQQGIVFVCVKKPEPSAFYFFQNEVKSQIHFCCTFQIVEKKIKFLVHDCFGENIHCVIEYFVSRCQIPNLPRNVDRNAALLSTCDPQHFPLCVPNSHLLFLIRSALGVECFCVDVKRKILDTLESKVYT